MARIVDLAGARFGSLTVVSLERRPAHRRPVWLCRCDCGGEAEALNGELRSGRKISCADCGARRRLAVSLAAGFGSKGAACVNYRHGAAQRGSHTKEYRAWASMIRRCELPSQRSFPDYGGRGIKVCAAWRGSFEAFLRDLGPAPTSGHSIDRVDVNGNYEPGNVRWAPRRVQANNSRRSVKLAFGGLELTVAEWAARCGVKYQTLWARIFVSNWPIERALGRAVPVNH